MIDLVTLAQWLWVALCFLLLLVLALGGVIMQFEEDRRSVHPEDADETPEMKGPEPTVAKHRRN